MLRHLLSISFFLYFMTLHVNAQLLHNTVISSAGTEDSLGDFHMSFTLGDLVVATATNDSVDFYTQGFQQPIYTSSVPPLTIDNVDVSGNIDCEDSVKVKVVVEISGGVAPYIYLWNLGVVQVVDTSSYTSDTLEVSVAGNYQIRVFDTTGNFALQNFTVRKDTACAEDPLDSLHFYNTVTTNGDGFNDHWHISGIENFPDNNITLFNIWGNRIWRAKGYDNVTVLWRGENEKGQMLPPATYFYVAEVNGEIYKGWIELIY